MAGGSPRRQSSRIESRLRQVREQFTPYVDAAWEHLKANWTDGLLAVGFVIVALLSAYVLLRG
jgi:hypothetical protein